MDADQVLGVRSQAGPPAAVRQQPPEGTTCITQLKAQGHSRTCNESKEEEEEEVELLFKLEG